MSTNISLRPQYYGNVFEPIQESESTRHFFGAANSKRGFVSFFDSIFSPSNIDTLYILGGGPGSGKSTMMKKVASLSEKRGFLTEHIHCSSSPSSLDGVIIPEKKIAVIDGTSPHTYLPTCPGVREICIDPGAAWDTKALAKRRDIITCLAKAKKKAYKKAYIYLRAAGLLNEDEAQTAFSHTLCEKLEKNVRGIFEKEPSFKKRNPRENKNFSPEIRLQSAICGKGSVYFESYSKMAQKTYLVNDMCGISALWFKKLYDIAKEKALDIAVSFSPEDPDVIDGIFFKDSRCAFTIYASEYDKCINCARFADKEHFSAVRLHRSFVSKSRACLLREAFDALESAAKYHEKIEEEYRPCTDFSITENISEKLCDMIFQ